MALITDTATIQEYVSVDIQLQQKSVLPYMENGKQQIVRLLGKTLYNAMDTWYNTDPQPENAEYTALLPYVQRALANFALYYGLSALNVSIGPTGIGVVSSQNLAPASKERTNALKTDLLDAAYDAMETMLEFLEENIDDYPAWESSDAYARQYELLITSGRDFDEILPINRSRLTFINWRPTMKDVQLLDITPQVSAGVVAELLTQIKAGTLTDANTALLAYLQKALAYLTQAREIKKTEDDTKQHDYFHNLGMQYLVAGKRLMDDNPSDYATYVASDVYDADRTTYKPFENTDDRKIYVAGI